MKLYKEFTIVMFCLTVVGFANLILVTTYVKYNISFHAVLYGMITAVIILRLIVIYIVNHINELKKWLMKHFCPMWPYCQDIEDEDPYDHLID